MKSKDGTEPPEAELNVNVPVMEVLPWTELANVPDEILKASHPLNSVELIKARPGFHRFESLKTDAVLQSEGRAPKRKLPQDAKMHMLVRNF